MCQTLVQTHFARSRWKDDGCCIRTISTPDKKVLLVRPHHGALLVGSGGSRSAVLGLLSQQNMCALRSHLQQLLIWRHAVCRFQSRWSRPLFTHTHRHCLGAPSVSKDFCKGPLKRERERMPSQAGNSPACTERPGHSPCPRRAFGERRAVGPGLGRRERLPSTHSETDIKPRVKMMGPFTPCPLLLEVFAFFP